MVMTAHCSLPFLASTRLFAHAPTHSPVHSAGACTHPPSTCNHAAPLLQAAADAFGEGEDLREQLHQEQVQRKAAEQLAEAARAEVQQAAAQQQEMEGKLEAATKHGKEMETRARKQAKLLKDLKAQLAGEAIHHFLLTGCGGVCSAAGRAGAGGGGAAAAG
jgi:hypothetical protein